VDDLQLGSSPRKAMSFSISKRSIVRSLTAMVCFLIAAHVSTQLLRFTLGTHFIERAHLVSTVRQFNLDQENNIGNWYQSCALLFCAALLGAIAAGKQNYRDRYTRHWTMLAVIFLGLSMDESASMHEMTIEPLKTMLHTGGFLFQAWVILGLAFVLIVGIAYLRFLGHLTLRERFWFLLSGAIYVAGTVGMEILDGKYESIYGDQTLAYGMLTLLEECLEMTGILLFIYTLLTYLESHAPEFGIRIGNLKQVSQESERELINSSADR
jgi:hypothetical protein